MHLEKLNMYQKKVSFFYTCLIRDYIRAALDLNVECCVTEEPVSFDEKDLYHFKNAKSGEIWGRDWQCAWFHLTGKIPAEWDGQSVCVRINIGGEGLFFFFAEACL